MRREVWRTAACQWKTTTAVDRRGLVRTRLMVGVELWAAWLGWTVVVRYGPVTSRRWCWSGRSANAVFDAAVATAQEYACSWPDVEQRSTLPLHRR